MTIITNSDIKNLLIRDLENKKVYNASWDTECRECEAPILEGDEFYFMGSKEKVCTECFRNIIEYLS